MTCGVLAVITFCSGIALGASYDFDRAVLSTTTEDIDEDYPTNLQVKLVWCGPTIILYWGRNCYLPWVA